MKKKLKAIVLLSGGMDSAVLLYWAHQRYDCTALTFDYGQKHKREIRSARMIAQKLRCRWIKIRVNMPRLKSSLTLSGMAIPKGDIKSRPHKTIPPTYVPGRNTLFISYALSIAESEGLDAILIGANAVDYSGYPDCRPDYIRAMQKVARLGTKAGRNGRPIAIRAPFVHKSKGQIVRTGQRLGVPFHLTWSCYRGGRTPCGRCDACLLRDKGFLEAKNAKRKAKNYN